MVREQKLFPAITALGVAALGAGLVADGAAVAEGVSRGLSLAAGVLIPSLFPFMALAIFLAGTRYGRILSLPLWPVTTRLLKLPGELGVVVLLALVGGYPVGARMIADLLRENRIDRETAERMLCFSVNAGPSFVVTAVGAGLFASREAGFILLAAQLAATLLIGVAVSLRAKPGAVKIKPPPDAGSAAALVSAVSGAAAGMLSMCAFAVLFSGLLSLVNATGVVQNLAALLPLPENAVSAAVAALLEVTAGTAEASRVGGLAGLVIASTAISFGGCSVLFQVMACFSGLHIRFKPFLLSRLAHMPLAAAMAAPLYALTGGTAPVWLASAPPKLRPAPGTVLLSVCLLALCCILTLQTRDEENR
jgi:sporulation integral membrane protein YlbJ